MFRQILIYGFPVLWWVLLIVSFTKDRSRYRNCYLLFIAIVSTLGTAVLSAGEYRRYVAVGIFIVTAAAVLAVPFFLIHNGIVMFRREGHSLGNLLSLLFGLMIGAGEISVAWLFLGPLIRGRDWLVELYISRMNIVLALIGVSVLYVSVVFLIFMIYSLFLQIIPRKRDFDYIIIHGAGLIGGEKVSKLLADRIDKAIAVYHRDPTPPVLIPSGGKGSDEKISEAEAMARYLLDKGIPAEHIMIEDKSATTFENIRNSKELIEAAGGRSYTALVTSNYHVYRALRYCRKVGLKCTGIGSHVAMYFWPSALIREFVAVHSEKKHFLQFAAGWLVCVGAVLIIFLF